MHDPIHITALSTSSALGHTRQAVWDSYKRKVHLFTSVDGNWVAQLEHAALEELKTIPQESRYRTLDKTVHLALQCSRSAFKESGWTSNSDFGINIGSSRGATRLFEQYYDDFKASHKTSPLSSPSTTLGNISSWVAHDLKSKGPTISHSVTCSTALHALLNGIAWIKAGLSTKFMAGGAEAPLTAFTIGQMKALKVYSQENEHYPCRALDISKTQNSMVLSEAAGMVCLESGHPEHSLGYILGFGYATEPLTHGASLSSNAQCIQDAMAMALGDIPSHEVDVVITHTPGTLKGDLAEYKAIKSIFCNKIPALTTNKWKVGHSLGASGLLSIEMALLMLEHQEFLEVPFLDQKPPSKLSKIMVNAVGFGGNAVSILLSK